eukprot:6127983-Pyramimonas_sp.AAC.1
MCNAVTHITTSSEFSASCPYVFDDKRTRMLMMRSAFLFCSGHAAGSTAVRDSRTAGLVTVPGAHSQRLRKECRFPRT